MTQKEFESTKEWLEKVTGMEFFDDQARLDEDGTAIFEKYIDADKRVTLFIDDKEALLYLNLLNDEYSGIEICRHDRNNAHLCADVLHHMIHWN